MHAKFNEWNFHEEKDTYLVFEHLSTIQKKNNAFQWYCDSLISGTEGHHLNQGIETNITRVGTKTRRVPPDTTHREHGIAAV